MTDTRRLFATRHVELETCGRHVSLFYGDSIELPVYASVSEWRGGLLVATAEWPAEGDGPFGFVEALPTPPEPVFVKREPCSCGCECCGADS